MDERMGDLIGTAVSDSSRRKSRLTDLRDDIPDIMFLDQYLQTSHYCADIQETLHNTARY